MTKTERTALESLINEMVEDYNYTELCIAMATYDDDYVKEALPEQAGMLHCYLSKINKLFPWVHVTREMTCKVDLVGRELYYYIMVVSYDC